MDNCLSCNNELNDNSQYCHRCGSKVIRERLTIKRLFRDSIKAITNLEGPFIKTTSTLITSPQNVTIDYIYGKRKLIISPVRYALIALTFYAAFQFLFQDFVNSLAEESGLSAFLIGYSEGSANNIDDGRLDTIKSLFIKYNQFTNYIAIPVIAWMSSIYYKKSKFNYAEHFSISLYAISLSLLIGAISGIILGLFSNDQLMVLYVNWTFIINVIIVIWIIYKSYYGNLLRAIAVFILSYFIYLMVVGGIIMAFTNVEIDW